MKCVFCNEKVEEEYEAISGCKKCVKEWVNNMDMTHDVS